MMMTAARASRGIQRSFLIFAKETRKDMTEEKEWVRLGGKDGVYLVEGEDYTVDREAGLLTINEKAWAKVPAKCIKYPDVPVDVGYVEEGQEEMGNGGE